jgi:hypothetical protein
MEFVSGNTVGRMLLLLGRIGNRCSLVQRVFPSYGTFNLSCALIIFQDQEYWRRIQMQLPVDSMINFPTL